LKKDALVVPAEEEIITRPDRDGTTTNINNKRSDRGDGVDGGGVVEEDEAVKEERRRAWKVRRQNYRKLRREQREAEELKNSPPVVDLNVLYRDERFAIVAKPPGFVISSRRPSSSSILILIFISRSTITGIAVHPPPKPALQKLLGKQLGVKKASPAHRLDLQTSGVVMFTLAKQHLQEIRPLISNKELCQKNYLGECACTMVG